VRVCVVVVVAVRLVDADGLRVVVAQLFAVDVREPVKLRVVVRVGERVWLAVGVVVRERVRVRVRVGELVACADGDGVLFLLAVVERLAERERLVERVRERERVSDV
jgi:hypothetical protein